MKYGFLPSLNGILECGYFFPEKMTKIIRNLPKASSLRPSLLDCMVQIGEENGVNSFTNKLQSKSAFTQESCSAL